MFEFSICMFHAPNGLTYRYQWTNEIFVELETYQHFFTTYFNRFGMGKGIFKKDTVSIMIIKILISIRWYVSNSTKISFVRW